MQLFLAFDSEYKQHSDTVGKQPIIAWILLDDQGHVKQSGGKTPLAEIAEKCKSLPLTVHVFIISPDVVIMQVPRPAGSFNKIRQAIPFLLEEHLAEDIDLLHFSVINPSSSNTISIAVINKVLMKECVDMLLAAHLVPQTIIPFSLALPIPEESQWTILTNAEYAWVRSGAFAGFSLERSMVTNLLETLPPAQLPKSIHWITAENIKTEIDECKKRNIEVKKITIPSKGANNWLEYIAKTYKPASHVNLLQGEFSIQQQTGSDKRWWDLVKKLSVAIVVVWFVGLVGQYFFLRWEHFYLQTQIESVYREVFPDTPMVSSPRTIFEREIGLVSSGKVGSDFLSLLLRVGEVTSNFPQIQIIEIVYNERALTISMMADNFSRLQQLDEKMQEVGLTVVQETASSSGGTVNARWKIS